MAYLGLRELGFQCNGTMRAEQLEHSASREYPRLLCNVEVRTAQKLSLGL